MIKNKSSLILFVLLFSTSLANAQFNQVGSMVSAITAASSDVDKLFSGYLKPYANAFGADMSGGWYNTARPHKLLGFDLTLSVCAAQVPASDKTFNLSNLNLAGTITPGQLNGTPTLLSPTIAGAKGSNGNTNPQISEYLPGYPSYPVAQFTMPNGTGYGLIPAPILQLGIGLIKGTEVDFRYLPNISIGDAGSVQLWGLGLKHSIKQWIPGISMAPFFHLSVFAAYSQLKTNVNLNFAPQDLEKDLPEATLGNLTDEYNNQQMLLTFNNFTGDILASFDLPIVTFYAGVGFCYSSTNLKVNGTYPMAGISNDALVIDDKFAVTNPINISMSSVQGSATKPRINAGIKFTLAVITIHFDYTLANYSVYSAGLGISFR